MREEFDDPIVAVARWSQVVRRHVWVPGRITARKGRQVRVNVLGEAEAFWYDTHGGAIRVEPDRLLTVDLFRLTTTARTVADLNRWRLSRMDELGVTHA